MASIATIKTPPLFREDDMDYEQWKKDLLLWIEFTDLTKEKVAIAVHLSLSGRARLATSEISIENMKSAKGIDFVIEKLDRVFLQDINWRCFNNYLAFESYRRESEVTIDQYLSEFDKRHYKLKECGVDLPDAVVACRLIKSCNLSEVQFQLALTTTQTMTFEAMRTTLKKLFAECGNRVTSYSGDKLMTVYNSNTEPASINETYYGERYGNGYRRGFSDRRQYSGRYTSRRGTGNRRGNPVGRDGRVTTCNSCGSTMHWARACPNFYSSQIENTGGKYEADDEVHITLIASEQNFDDKIDILRG
jgi:hypothetical protein